MQRGYIITTFLLIIALIFAIQNTSSISLRFLTWEFQGSQALIIIVIFFLGFLAGWVFGWRNIWKKNGEIKTLRKQVTDLSRPVPPPSSAGSVH